MKAATLLALLALAFASANAAPGIKFTPGLAIGTEENIRNICAIAVAPDDTLLVAADGKIRSFDPATGKCISSFPTGLTRADALATDGNTIYLFATRTETRTVEQGNRKLKQEVPTGVLCKRFSMAGQPAPDLTLDAKSVASARVVGKTLYLGDLNAHTVRLFDLETGKQTGSVGRDLRLCCGIFDFSVEKTSGDLLVANLGAFKVQRYNAAGKLLTQFGQRGESDRDFQGCCNPVSVASLADGSLVTVEKQPSRVKVCSPDGKLIQVFPKLEQLVEGCQQVSLAVDSRGRVYLGVNARKHFVLQYVPQT